LFFDHHQKSVCSETFACKIYKEDSVACRSDQ